MKYKGFDISQWNGNCDLAAAKKSGMDFVIIRSSFGNVAAYPQQVDTKWYRNVKNAIECGCCGCNCAQIQGQRAFGLCLRLLCYTDLTCRAMVAILCLYGYISLAYADSLNHTVLHCRHQSV